MVARKIKKEERKIEEKEESSESKEVGNSEEEGVDKNNGQDTLSRLRENPWIVSTFVLGFLFVGSLVFSGAGVSSNVLVANQEDVSDSVLNFLNAQVGGGVDLSSIDKKDGYYEVIVDFQGDQVPLFVSLTGNYIFTGAVPLDDSVLSSPDSGESINHGRDFDAKIDVETGDSPVKGDVNAPVTIIEFSDYECPFCGKFYTEVLPLIDENYIQTGKVKLVFRDFPLSFHPNAQKAAEAARCVRSQLGDEGYFEMHNKIFENQRSLSENSYVNWAVEIGVNSAEFEECLKNGDMAGKVQEDFAYGAELGVSGTPAFFVNGIMVSGAQPYQVFEQIIEGQLEELA